MFQNDSETAKVTDHLFMLTTTMGKYSQSTFEKMLTFKKLGVLHSLQRSYVYHLRKVHDHCIKPAL